MRCANPFFPRDRETSEDGRRRHARRLLVLFLVGFATPAAAQSVLLRGPLDGAEANESTADATAPLRSSTGDAAAVASDLLGLGEAASPLDLPAADGGGPVLDRIDPTAAGAATAVSVPATTGTSAVAAARRRSAPVVAIAPTTASTGAVTATAAIEPARRSSDTGAGEAETEDEAYRALGLRTGGMVWYPALEASFGRKSNVDSARGGRGSTTWLLEPSLTGRSDWSRHSLEITLRGSQTAYPEASDQTRAEYETKLRGRLDLGDETKVEIGAGWARRRESSSANEASTAGEGTDRETGSLSLGLTRDVGLVAVTLRGALERNDYVANGTLATGTTDPAVQNNSLWTGSLRTTFGPTRSIAPFVELRATARRYDEEVVYGQRRDGDGAAALVGVVADAGPVLRGEVATGWGFEKPADSSLATMSGWLLEGSLTWSPTRLAVVRTKVTSSFEPTTNTDSPGTISRAATVDLDYALRRDLTASLGAGYTTKHYFGIDVDEDTASLSAGLTYKFDRTFQTFLRGRFERTTASNAPSYDVVTILTGVRIQR